MTIDDMKNHFEQKYGIEVSMITYGSATVFSSFGGKDSQARLPLKVETAIESVSKKEFPKWRKIIPIGISGNTVDGIDCLLPDVRYTLC
jgi:ubiquitin-activating enzyme E1